MVGGVDRVEGGALCKRSASRTQPPVHFVRKTPTKSRRPNVNLRTEIGDKKKNVHLITSTAAGLPPLRKRGHFFASFVLITSKLDY